jgi:hypothetical protein
MANRWLVESATGRFLEGGFFDVQVTDPATQMVVTLPDERMPDTTSERYDPQAPWMRRPASAEELQQESLATADADADREARNPTLLAMMGTVLEKFDPTWAAMTQAQRKNAILAMADRFAQLRRFVERNL